jgi:hypothetical protein
VRGLTRLARHWLHRLDVAERVKFPYLRLHSSMRTAVCTAKRPLYSYTWSNVRAYDSEEQSLLTARSSESNQLIIPFVRLIVVSERGLFSVAGPALWNSLLDYLRDAALTFPTFFTSPQNISLLTHEFCRCLSAVYRNYIVDLRYTNLQLQLQSRQEG